METDINLLDFPPECFHYIFEKCTLSTLMNLSDTCSKLRQAAYAYFATKLQVHTTSFNALSDLDIRKLFRLFGALFQTIDSTHFDSPERSQYFQDRFLEGLVHYCPHINDFTLFQFHISHDVIEQIKIFFPQLKSFQLKDCYFEDCFTYDILPIQCNQLQTFLLHCAFEFDPESSCRHFTLNQSFPNLTHISFSNSVLSDMPQFFQMNPQISWYEEHYCTNAIVPNVIQYLPNIRLLKLIYLHEKTILFENIHRLQQLNSLYITAWFQGAVIISRLESNSLQNLHINGFILDYNARDISKFSNLRTLCLEKCKLGMDYVVEICKKCKNLIEIDLQYSCNDFPTNDQLLQIVDHAKNLEKLNFTDVYIVERISIDHFMHLAHIVRNRNKTLFISILSQRKNAIVHTFTDINIELKQTIIEENPPFVENVANEQI